MMDSSTPSARLCHIIKWDHFDGYGFNLHAEKGKTGQFIGKVDDGSPSEAAGLRQGDRIVEVNEINIANETHKQVVERIKAFPTETKLLVVDQIADDYYKANNIPIKGTMHGIKYLKTPERHYDNQDDDDVDVDDVDHHLQINHNVSRLDDDDVVVPQASKNTSNGSQGTTSDTHSIASSSGDNHSISNNSHGKENGSNNNGTTTTSTTGATNNSMITRHEDEDNISNKSSSSSSNNKDAIQSISANGTTGSLNLLQMSAKELRAKLAQRKKYDPKKESMGFKDKFDIVQKL